MKSDLAVQYGFGLEEHQKDFSQSLWRVYAAVREAGFQMGSQRVSMQPGGFGVRHRL
ncbi:hypothetical protein [Deinococcus sp. QL22]|uniref:hypothetical protein n=1 Tax=Deinococcus sp. QL22 TaxID=2939437 RepID=UPI002016D656|nr:hypothetical protein [Deinococcus sp. QL22]UQN08559.1 hypothetical protein M1R55_16835 [Deinococcus sp. QL22]